jgi:hypothetical protein
MEVDGRKTVEDRCRGGGTVELEVGDKELWRIVVVESWISVGFKRTEVEK